MTSQHHFSLGHLFLGQVLRLDLGQGFRSGRGVERSIDQVIDLVRDASDELTSLPASASLSAPALLTAGECSAMSRLRCSSSEFALNLSLQTGLRLRRALQTLAPTRHRRQCLRRPGSPPADIGSLLGASADLVGAAESAAACRRGLGQPDSETTQAKERGEQRQQQSPIHRGRPAPRASGGSGSTAPDGQQAVTEA